MFYCTEHLTITVDKEIKQQKLCAWNKEEKSDTEKIYSWNEFNTF